jgi:hypothetical protein
VNDSPASLLIDKSAVAISSATDAASINRLCVDSRISAGLVAPLSRQASLPVASQFRVPAKFAGSPNLLVNGSVTPQVFTVSADATKTLTVTEVTLVASAACIAMSGNKFLSMGAALTNGLLVELVSGGVTTPLANFKVSEDIILGFNGPNHLVCFSGQASLRVSHYCLNPLASNSADMVRVTVRDNLMAVLPGGAVPTYLQIVAAGTVA